MIREISYMKYEKGRLTGLVTSYAETAFSSKISKDKGRNGSDQKTRKKT
jgi:hypothetical protein